MRIGATRSPRPFNKAKVLGLVKQRDQTVETMEGGQRANDVPVHALSLELMWRSIRWFAAKNWLKKLSTT
jgi:hypothetical protein